jgi:hypothetical protein
MRNFAGELAKDSQHSRSEVTKANERLVKMTEQALTNTRGQQEAAQVAWDAWKGGMQLQMEATAKISAWERQFMMMEMDRAQQSKPSEVVEKGKSWIKDFAPFFLAGWGQLLTSRGSPQGEFFQKMAMNMLSGEDDEEEEEVVVKPAKVKKPSEPVMGMPIDVDAREHFEKNPLNAMLQLFNSKLTPEQREKLQQIVPPQTWDTLQSALKAPNEQITQAYLIQFVIGIKAVKGLDDQLIKEMNEEQNSLFGDIVRMVMASISGMKKKPEAPEVKTEAPEPTAPEATPEAEAPTESPAPEAVPPPAAPKKKKKTKEED